jgi:hypothetical protein
MSETNDWPGKPGVPLNPERDGWHWVDDGANGTEPRFWGATFAEWDGYPLWMAEEWDYLRPCSPDDITPAEVEARIATARKDALEDCAKWHDEVAAEYKKEQLLYEERESWTVAYVFAQGYVINKKRATAIRALAKGEGDD